MTDEQFGEAMRVAYLRAHGWTDKIEETDWVNRERWTETARRVREIEAAGPAAVASARRAIQPEGQDR